MSRLLADPQEFADKFLKKLLINLLTTNVLKDFYAYGNAYYGRNEIVGEFDTEEDFLRQTGILSFTSSWEEDEDGNAVLVFYDVSYLDDRDKYLEAILERKEKEFKQKYADYDVILRKLELLKQAIVELGFKIG